MSSQRSQQMQQQREVTINSRVESNGVVGTVKYIGPVVGTQGTWVGVDWDIPEKGKNDGSYKNVRYFTTSFPSSGSFLRLTKLNTGRSFFEALIDRYENNVIAPSESLLTLAQRSGNNRVIEYVGFDKVSEKQKEFDQLLQLDLSKQYVSYAGDVSAANLSAVQHLDLSANLLSSWSVVADIVKHLPSLNSLVLSANRLVAENCSQLAPCFDKVKTLVYGKANYTWNDVVVVIGKLFRHIENLDVWGNAITKITTPPNSVFQELKSLNLSDNKLKDWSMVCKLGNLPLLESLQLVNCEISEIEFGDNLLPTKETHLFSSLKSLNLARNQIKKWTSIAQLNRLSSLEELFIKNNPVFDEEKYDTVFNLIIGKIRRLKILNREAITECLRKEAELYYLKRFYKSWLQSSGDAFTREHPLYSHFIKTYGEPTELLEDIEMAKEKKFVRVKLKCSLSDKTIDKKLPRNTTIRALRIMMKRLFNIGPFKNFSLLVESSSHESHKYEMDNDMEDINYYAVDNGDLIFAQTQL